MAHRVPIEATLDLHAFRPEDVTSVVTEYLTAAAEAGLPDVRVVHGRGIGVQRAQVQRQLASHPDVAEFWDDPRAHLGATIVRLRPRPGTRPG
ncbi:MAG: Smr/MutS family protein [Vicinamibacterales bacterium]